MSEIPVQVPADAEFRQVAVHCYLSTVLAVAECMAEACPTVGVAFRKRWRGIPQRLGFDLSAASLESSRRTVEHDLRTFGQLAGNYFDKGLPLIGLIAGNGGAEVDSALNKLASHIVMLETLADSIDTVADFDVPTDVQGTLQHQAAGLRTCARQAQAELLPLVSRLQALIRQCEEVVSGTEEACVVDPHTGFLNGAGLRHEFDLRRNEGTLSCVLMINCRATLHGGKEATDSQFYQVAEALSNRISEQFRSEDAIGRLDRRIVVLFNGKPEQAASRKDSMERAISGKYQAAGITVSIAAEITVTGTINLQLIEESLKRESLTEAGEPALS
jgi:hypothetical protein